MAALRHMAAMLTRGGYNCMFFCDIILILVFLMPEISEHSHCGVDTRRDLKYITALGFISQFSTCCSSCSELCALVIQLKHTRCRAWERIGCDTLWMSPSLIPLCGCKVAVCFHFSRKHSPSINLLITGLCLHYKNVVNRMLCIKENLALLDPA